MKRIEERGICVGRWNKKEGYVVPKTRHPGAWHHIRRVIKSAKTMINEIEYQEEISIFMEDEHLVAYLLDGDDEEGEGKEILRAPLYPSY